MSQFKNRALQRISEKLSLPSLGLRAWLVLAFLTVLVNQRKYWADSELWAVSATRDFFAGKADYYFGIKPLFHFLLWGNFQLSQAIGLFPMDLARFIWSVFSLLILVLLDQFLKRKQVSVYLRILSILFLLSLSGWVYRSAEVRSDILVSLIAFGAVFLIEPLRRHRVLVLIIAFSLSMLITSKSIVIWICLSPVLIGELQLTQIQSQYRKNIFLTFGLVTGLLLFLAWDPLVRSFNFFLFQFSPEQMGFSYFSLYRIYHITGLHFKNPHFSIVLALTLVAGLFLLIREPGRMRRRYVVSWLLFVVLFYAYPDPLPFFLASLLPFLVLNTAMILHPVFDHWSEEKRTLVTVVLAPIFAGFFLFWWGKLYAHDNFEQKALATWAKGNLDKDHLLVFDPTGFSTTDNTVHWFLGPASTEANEWVFRRLKERAPEVVLFTNKLQYINTLLAPFLSENYLQVAPSVYLKALRHDKVIGCEEVYERLSETFFRNKERGAPILVWGTGEHGDSFDEIKIDRGHVCSFRFSDQMKYTFLPVRLKRTPAADLNQLFMFDSEM